MMAKVVVGNNAILGFRAKKTSLISQAQKKGFRASAVTDLWMKNSETISLDKMHCDLASHSEITARNTDTSAPLAGKKIALIGCGTIGGYLARSLVQLARIIHDELGNGWRV